MASRAAQSAEPERRTPSFSIYISDLKISGLERTRFKQKPDPVAVIFVDGQNAKETRVQKSTENPQWNEVLEVTLPSTPSTLEVKLYHNGWKNRVFLGSFAKEIDDILNDTPYDLQKNGVISGRIALKITRVSPYLNPTSSSATEAVVRSSIEDLASSTSKLSPIQNAISNESALRDRVQSVTVTVDAMVETISPLRDAIQSLSQLMKIFDGIAEIHPLCKAAWALLSGAYKIVLKQSDQDTAVLALCISIRDMLVFARGVRNLRQLEGGIDILKEMLRAVERSALLIEEYMSSSFAVRAAKGAVWDTMSARIETCRTELSYLFQQFDRAVGAQTLLTVEQMSTSVSRLQNEFSDKTRRDLLDRLPNIHSAAYDHVKPCLDGTRKELLNDLYDWASLTGDDQPRLFWLRGMAGMGKSTIATTFADYLIKSERLGGSFFFSRSVAERSGPENVFTTLASQLAVRIPKLSQSILDAIKEEPDIGKSAIGTQWKNLISSPLRATRGLELPIILVIDALDECTEPLDIVSVIGSDIHQLPSLFKIFVSSRPQPEMEVAFKSLGQMIRSHTLSTSGDSVEQDIFIFIAERLGHIAKTFELGDDWPGKSLCEVLARKSSGLFIWAATAAKFIEDKTVCDPESQLAFLLESSTPPLPATPWSPLDSLYLQVLEQAFPKQTPNARIALFQQIVGTIVTLKNPLSAAAIGSLLGIVAKGNMTGAKIVKRTLRDLQSVLVVPSDENEPIRIIHPSFIDFITSRDRCIEDRFFIDITLQHQTLAKRCLEIMNSSLHRNMCDVKPYTLNAAVPDLKDRISQYLPPCLIYACCFWADHLAFTSTTHELFYLVESLYAKRLLSWFEVLSLTGLFDLVFESLVTAEKWLRGHFPFSGTNPQLLGIASTCQRFVKEFRFPISQCASMVYYTALPQTPWMDPVAKAFNHILESEPVLKVHPREAFWSMCLMVFEGHRYPITSLAFSPDEKKIVSGSSDGTIRIWDVISGSTIGLPMGIAGIRDGINSVAWSPDGKMIAAGYDGAVVRLWSADSGNMVCAPLEGHSDFVTTVVFSSNGSKIASASLDETIRIWAILSNTPNCISIVEVGDVIVILTFSSDDESLLYACQNAGVKRWSMSQGRILDEYPYPDGSPDARSVAFSHDGSKAAVAFAYISTPHLLDVVTCIWSTFEGPSQSSPGEMIGASAVAFSRDGRYLVSGHDDAGIQIWDLAAMAMREHILKGHTSFVTCVACGDLYFVSGSYDYTIRLWAPPLAPVLFSEPEILSPSLVASIAHSPDGTKLVSGLFDGSLQFWDAATGATLSKTQKEHTSVVSCVAFSADGTRVVSGSFDKNLCLWEVSSCSKIGTAFVGHTRSVWSAVFSLDGTLIASGSSDAAVRLWDPASSTSIGSPFLGHSSTVFSVLFSLDGSQIISSSRDQSIRVWTIEPHTEVVHARFLHADSAYFLTRSLDSKYVISISADGTVVCWDAESQTHQPPGADVLLGQKLVVDFRHGWVKDMYGKVWGWLPSQFRGTAFRAIAACGHRLVVSDGKGGLTTFDFSKVISE